MKNKFTLIGFDWGDPDLITKIGNTVIVEKLTTSDDDDIYVIETDLMPYIYMKKYIIGYLDVPELELDYYDDSVEYAETVSLTMIQESDIRIYCSHEELDKIKSFKSDSIIVFHED